MKHSFPPLAIGLWAFLLILDLSALSEAQGMRSWRMEGRCLRALELTLTAEQVRGLQQLQQAYLQDTQNLRALLITKRIELRDLLTDPSAKTDAIHAKYMEVVEIQSKLEARAIDYLLKVRHLLTQEQLPLWCPEEEFPVLHKGMPGHRPKPRPMPPVRTHPLDE